MGLPFCRTKTGFVCDDAKILKAAASTLASTNARAVFYCGATLALGLNL